MPTRHIGFRLRKEESCDVHDFPMVRSMNIRRFFPLFAIGAIGATVAIGALQVLKGDLSTGALVTCMLVVWPRRAPGVSTVALMLRSW